MKLFLVKSELLTTPYDNKKSEIKKYTDNLDFKPSLSKETNFLKRVALLLLNEEEIGPITIDFKDNQIEYKNNIENLVAAKIMKKEEILIKVLSHEEEFIKKYQAKESNIESIDRNIGFINWEEKNQITKDDWNNIDFLKERIELSSFEDVYQELLKKKNKIYLSNEFIDMFVRENSQEIKDYYFSKLTSEELKYSTIIKAMENYEKGLFLGYLCQAMTEENKKDKELINIIKTEIINEENIKEIFHRENINKLINYIPAKLRSHEHIISCITTNINSSSWSINRISLDDAFKIIGKKYFTNKENFILFINRIQDTPMRTNDATDKLLNEVIKSFDLSDKNDKYLFDSLCDCAKDINEYKLANAIVKKIVENNKEKLTEKEKINLYSRGIISLEYKEVLEMIKDENDLEFLLKNNTRYNKDIIQEKIKETPNLEEFITKKENIINFLKISFYGHWLKNKKIPQSWKEDNDLLIHTYGSTNYNDLPLAKRKELEESKEDIKLLIKLNHNNFNYIRNEMKYESEILKQFAYDDPTNFKEILKEIPSKKWYNFNYALKLLDYHPASLEYIPSVLFDNKQFTLSIFEKYETNNAYNIKELLSKIPEELKSFLQDNNITSDYVNLLNKHFLKDSLEINLTEKNQKVKKLKI